MEASITFTQPVAISTKSTTPEPAKTFREYTSRLLQWEKVLLENIYKQLRSIQKLKEHIQCADNILLVTDSGLTEELGHLRWCIATEETILWIGNEHVVSNLELNESLQTEGISYISLLQFLLYYTNYHNIQIQENTMSHYCDNKVQVNRMQWYNTKIVDNPFSHMQPDDDV
eukprot:536448-Ditylum_brightwellii.AAC.1